MSAGEWSQVNNVAQYDEASWGAWYKEANTSPEKAQQIANDDQTVSAYFVMKSNMVLAKHGTFNAGDAVFIKARPWTGSASQADMWVWKTAY